MMLSKLLANTQRKHFLQFTESIENLRRTLNHILFVCVYFFFQIHQLFFKLIIKYSTIIYSIQTILLYGRRISNTSQFRNDFFFVCKSLYKMLVNLWCTVILAIHLMRQKQQKATTLIHLTFSYKHTMLYFILYVYTIWVTHTHTHAQFMLPLIDLKAHIWYGFSFIFTPVSIA